MKKIFCLLLAISISLSLCIGLTSCGDNGQNAKINVYFGNNVYDFDPTDYYEDNNANQLMSLIFEPLFKVDADGELQCAAAKSYKIYEKENTVVIKLRESYWSDEKRVKADDFIFSWRDITLNPNFPNPAAALLYDINLALEIKTGAVSIDDGDFGAYSSDEYEITIKCRDGANIDRLLRNLASVTTSPVRSDIVKLATNKHYWAKAATLNSLVTNGAFKISALDYDSGRFMLSKNNGYHQALSADNSKVAPSVLNQFIDSDGTVHNLTYEDIENKVVFYLADTSLEDRKDNKANAITANGLSTYTYVFNTENPLLSIEEVRHALSLALDREAMAEAVVFATAANGFLPSNVGGFQGDRISTKANLKAAEKLLENVDFTGITKSFTLSVNNDKASVAMADIAKKCWEKLGFTVQINALGTKASKLGGIDFVDSELQVLMKSASYGDRSYDVMGLNWQLYSDDPFVALAAFSEKMSGNGRDFLKDEYRRNISG